MMRLVGFFALSIVVWLALQRLPGIGWIFGNVFGFFLVTFLVSGALSRFSRRALDLRRERALRRQFEAVDTPNNQGKLGALMAGQGRYGAAIPHLRRAVEGEPDSQEWRFRLGTALLGTGDVEGAVAVLREVAERDEEHGYGAVQLRLAEALTARGDAEGALEHIERFERNHGENPESAYRRGLAHRAAGRRDRARESFARVGQLGSKAPSFQRGQNRKWVLRALLARLG